MADGRGQQWRERQPGITNRDVLIELDPRVEATRSALNPEVYFGLQPADRVFTNAEAPRKVACPL